MSIHTPQTAFAIATGLSELISLAARQGEAINAVLGQLAAAGMVLEVDESISPGSLLPDDNLLVLATELKVVATRLKVRNRHLQQVRSSIQRDDESTVSRETQSAERVNSRQRGK